MRTTGILVDLWHRPSTDGIPGVYLLWLRTADGVICVEDREFHPSFSAIPSSHARLVEQAMAQHENIARTEMSCRYPSIYAADKAPVIRAFMLDERRAEETMREIRARAPAEVRFAEWKLLPELQWYYLRRIPPHSSVSIEAEGGVLQSIDYLGPADSEALKVLAIYPAFTTKVPANCRIQSITLRYGREEAAISGREEDVLAEMQRRLDGYDPDALAIFDADWEALPLLGLRAQDNNMRLRLGRLSGGTKLYPPRGAVRHWQAKQVRAPGRILLDLWKDARTDADLKRTGLDLDDVYGAEFHESRKSPASMVYDLARERLPMLMSWCHRCLMPLDSVCREKHGFMNASSVNSTLIESTVIPDEPEYPEGFKTPLTEQLKENGGLVITPEAGLHENVAIVDFSSLFPRIFVKHNISPETINCRHPECREKGDRVPFLDFHICQKRKGVYPEVFGKVLAERDAVKTKLKGLDPASEEYRKLEMLYKSLKMQLVSPYGYMQFALNNFRSVDGNRSIPAYGRHYLLKARDIAEDEGFNVIYADTDSLFIQGGNKESYAAFCSRISADFGLELKLEHVCRWVLFLPEHPGGKKGLKKKYFASVGGEVLVRGLEVRRQDRAAITKKVQEHVLEMLASANNTVEFQAMIPKIAAYVRGEVARIQAGAVTPEELAIVRKLSHRPEEYKAAPHHAVAAEALSAKGHSVRVGGKVEYIVTGTSRAIPLALAGASVQYDVASYVENTVHPIYMLLREFGLKYEDLLPGPKQMGLDAFMEANTCPV
ncbi:DNA polymerase domain-containing protein [Methanocella sp. MCL-LM]|uniref:DNA polymerase domain-containing protein n=1 Tax=Methanocella sp. MCL-LM TaxID=3412035 RepID=UPI003C715720